jgi:hypothetical protein
MKNKTEKTQMNSPVECMTNLLEQGFTDNFIITDKGLVAEDKKSYRPDDVKIVSFYRFEGESDPADNSILYAIETYDGKKGMISDAYGAYASSKVTGFISKVEEITKKAHEEEFNK